MNAPLIAPEQVPSSVSADAITAPAPLSKMARLREEALRAAAQEIQQRLEHLHHFDDDKKIAIPATTSSKAESSPELSSSTRSDAPTPPAEASGSQVRRRLPM